MEVMTSITGYFYNAKCIRSKEESLVPLPSGVEGLLSTLYRGKTLEQADCSDRYAAHVSRAPCDTERGFDGPTV